MIKRISFEREYDGLATRVLNGKPDSAKAYLDSHKRLKDYFSRRSRNQGIDYNQVKNDILEEMQLDI